MSINRTTQQKKLGWLFEQNEDGHYKRFNFMKDRHDSNLLFRIPEHQRFPSWNKHKKKLLVDSVINNYPIHSIICSKHYKLTDGKIKEYYDIEDGQTRLSILQSYFNGDFTNEGGDYFKGLSPSIQRVIENYEVSIEIITIDDDNDDIIHEIFDRLQMGQPLKDCDKFWNWKDTPLIKYALELINSRKLDKYMGTSKFSSQKRDRLSDVVGLVSLIIYWNLDLEYINNSFKSHYTNIKRGIQQSDKDNVQKFLDYYFAIIDECYRIYPRIKNEQKKKFYLISNDLGLVLYDYFENSHIDLGNRKDMWTNYFIMSRKNNNFTTGSKQLWNNVEGKPTWTQPKYMGARCSRVIEFNNKRLEENLDDFCNMHNIELNSEPAVISNSDDELDNL